jgi:hypothetical protein
MSKRSILYILMGILSSAIFSCHPRNSGNNDLSGLTEGNGEPGQKTLSRLIVDPQHPRHFSDTLGNPVLLVGDSPQNLPQKLTTAEMHTYFADCESKGINLCWVCIDGQPTDRAIPQAPVDRKGNPEFMPGGIPENWDISRVNSAYFSETIDSVMIIAEIYGIYINLMPMSQCYWAPKNITANSPENCYKYGVFLGNRYKDQRNLLWLFGNDNLDSSRQCPIARGIIHSGDIHLMSIHVYDPNSPWGPDPDNPAKGKSGSYFRHLPHSTMTWVSYNNLYSEMTVWNQPRYIYYEYMKKDIMPIIMSEGPYQKLAGYDWQIATNQLERSLNYRVALGGGFGGGYTYGCDWLQRDTKPWDKFLNAGARPDIRYFRDLVKDRKWWNLKPDYNHSFLTATTIEGGFDIDSDNYTIAAYDTAQGTLGIAYCNKSQTLTLDLSKLSGPVTVQWYDPTTGEYSDVNGSPFSTEGLQKFTTPDMVRQEVNTDGSEEISSDWVLVAGTAQ